jgi:hypothetical protein
MIASVKPAPIRPSFGACSASPGATCISRSSPGGRCQASGEAAVSTISRSRARLHASPCDNFLYGFKGAPGGVPARRLVLLKRRRTVIDTWRPKTASACLPVRVESDGDTRAARAAGCARASAL